MDLRKKLFDLTVGDICSTGVVTVDHFQTIGEVATIFEKHDITGAPVVDEVGKCIGVISARDIVRYCSRQEQLQSQPGPIRDFHSHEGDHSLERTAMENPFDRVFNHMSSAVQTVPALTKLHRAAEVMCMEHIHRLIVLDETSRPVGILTSLDIVATLWNLKLFNDLTGKL